MIELVSDSNYTTYYCSNQEKVIETNDLRKRENIFLEGDYESWLKNGLHTLRTPGTYLQFNNLIPIPPKSIVRFNRGSQSYTLEGQLKIPPHKKKPRFIELNEEFKKVISEFGNSKIAVELSGGLDSSLLIELLHLNNVDIYLFGYQSKLFEFRTERYIQDLYLKRFPNTILLDYSKNPAFSNLFAAPWHPTPVSESNFHERHNRMAQLCSENNIDILLSGEAGDQLLGFPVKLNSINKISGFQYWNLSEHWANQFIYSKYGVQYISGLALGNLPQILLSMRSESTLDPMKLWARERFKHILPKELSNFAYKAFHDNWVCEGLLLEYDNIEFHARKLDELNFKQFKIDEFLQMTINYSRLDEKHRTLYLSQLSYLVWMNSNLRLEL